MSVITRQCLDYADIFLLQADLIKEEHPEQSQSILKNYVYVVVLAIKAITKLERLTYCYV